VDVTVVVPTRDESGNVRELLNRLDNALGALSAEVLFVDDSDDETPAVISAARHLYPRPVRLLHREIGHRDGGLGGAVVAGLRRARAPWAVVIDGDLQHPPEVIPQLLERGSAEQLDLVAASRYHECGDAGGLGGRWRAAVSALCTFLAKMLFPRRLRGVSDPMSGFFAVRLAALNLAALRPVGYKVLLEILARCALPNRADVPYAFQPRFTGRSKASVNQGLRFFQHLYILRMKTSWEGTRSLVSFMAVGLTGVAVNTLALWLLSASLLRLPYMLASVISTQIAIVWNFALIEHLVFRRAHARSVANRLLRFWLVNVGLLPVQLGLLAFCVEALGWSPVGANLVVLAIVFGLRYAVSSEWVYRRSPVSPTNVAEHGGDLLRDLHRPGHPPRDLNQHQRPHRRHRDFHRRLGRLLPTVRVDHGGSPGHRAIPSNELKHASLGDVHALGYGEAPGTAGGAGANALYRPDSLNGTNLPGFVSDVLDRR